MDNDDSEDERANNHKQKKFGSMQLKKLQEVLPAMDKFALNFGDMVDMLIP